MRCEEAIHEHVDEHMTDCRVAQKLLVIYTIVAIAIMVKSIPTSRHHMAQTELGVSLHHNCYSKKKRETF